MAGHRLTLEQMQETLDAVKANGSISQAARMLGIPEGTLKSRYRAALAATSEGRLYSDSKEPQVPDLPADDLPVEELIALQIKRFEKRSARAEAKRWIEIGMPDDRPFGLLWFGDPHVDDNGCNWSLLRAHCAAAANAESVYGCSVGDITNNWVGRLTRLWADQDTSRATAQKFAKWLLLESGVRWLVWTLGNHDLWYGAELLKEYAAQAPQRLLMEDWGCQFQLRCPGGQAYRVWQSHNFPGNSMWNTLHGPQRAAHTKDWSHMYVCGDTHNWALHQEESASRQFTYWLIRTRGYKYLDSYGERLGHQSQREGASILTVVNPQAESLAAQLQCFADVETGLEYLAWLRKCV